MRVPPAFAALAISIHALREEGDTCFCLWLRTFQRFLSTPSARRATCQAESVPHCRRNFYPRPPRGGRPGTTKSGTWTDNFYPRPPRGGRPNSLRLQTESVLFLSTPSARRATNAASQIQAIFSISIHALREEGDTVPSSETTSVEDFYPRPPRGGRRGPA